VFDRKVNLVGALGRLKFPEIFKSAGKNMEKREFLRKIGFWCNSKTNDHRYVTFSLNVYIIIYYTP